MSDERARWEASELAGLARQHGAKRVQVEPGVFAWQFPAWLCPHCTPIGGPDTLPLPGCPCPIARHGPVNAPPTPPTGAASGGEGEGR